MKEKIIESAWKDKNINLNAMNVPLVAPMEFLKLALELRISQIERKKAELISMKEIKEKEEKVYGRLK